MKWRRDARDKRHFIIMSAVAALVLVIGLFFDQNGEQAVETSGTQTVTVREGAVTDAAVMADGQAAQGLAGLLQQYL